MNKNPNNPQNQASTTQGRRNRMNLSFDLAKSNCMKGEKTKSMKGGILAISSEVSSRNNAYKLKKEHKCQSPSYAHPHQSLHIP